MLPDIENLGSGFVHDLAIAHRRFAIVDLTEGGHQPMWNEEAGVCVSFNGEIYNHVELRKELEESGCRFSTSSDTEVLLKAYLHWGTDAFCRFNGFWALALYDRRVRRLLLSRDRIGKVPLYYTVKNGFFYWASEIKAFFSVCDVKDFRVRDQAVDDYIMHGLRDFDGTFWENVEDFPVASYAWINPDLSFRAESYWRLPSERMSAREITVKEVSRRVKELLWDSIQLRLRADVPIAFELSGGMDSSSVVALSAANCAKRFSTYTTRFQDETSNEEPFARAVAERYPDKIDYNVIDPGDDDFWTDADRFVALEEEPFHSPNLHTGQQQRKTIRGCGIKVVFSGAAGDEIFAGYSNEYFLPFLAYLLAQGRWSLLAEEFGRNTEYAPKRAVRELLLPMLPKKFRKSLAKRDQIVGTIYRRPEKLSRRNLSSLDFSLRMIRNMTAWKMNYWLRSSNKSTLGIPIEPRYPFLDYRLVEYAFSLPPEYLIRDGWYKWILRVAMQEVLPPEVAWRKTKMGFPFPYKTWLLHSKKAISANLKDLHVPHLDTNAFLLHFEQLVDLDPLMAWRLACTGLWWRKLIEKRQIVASP